LLSLLDIYGKRYELIAELRGHDDAKVPQREQGGDATTADGS
jgi:hypothetical protein